MLGCFCSWKFVSTPHFFRDGESFQPSPLPTGGRSRGNNPQLLSREGLVEMNMGKGFWLKIFDLGFLWKKQQILDNLCKVDGS